MVEIFGKLYYIDLEEISEKCKIETVIKDDDPENDGSIQIDVFKYEIIKMCLERILNEFEENDEKMGAFAQQGTSISFKIAFNTLIKNQILIAEEEDE